MTEHRMTVILIGDTARDFTDQQLADADEVILLQPRPRIFKHRERLEAIVLLRGARGHAVNRAYQAGIDHERTRRTTNP